MIVRYGIVQRPIQQNNHLLIEAIEVATEPFLNELCDFLVSTDHYEERSVDTVDRIKNS